MATAKPAAKITLDGRCYRGKATAYGLRYYVEMRPLEDNTAFYHNAFFCEADTCCQHTATPIPASLMLKLFDEHLRAEHGLMLTDFSWQAISPSQLLLLCPGGPADPNAPPADEDKADNVD